MNEVLNCLETRRSCRAYRPEQVPEEALQEILRAGLYAPSGMGRQSVKLLVVQDPAAIAALERLNGGVLGSPEAHPFYGAPTVCVVLADAAAFTAVEDGSLALGNLMNAAHSLGIASCWIHRAREVFASAEGCPAAAVGRRGRVDRHRPLHPWLCRGAGEACRPASGGPHRPHLS